MSHVVLQETLTVGAVTRIERLHIHRTDTVENAGKFKLKRGHPCYDCGRALHRTRTYVIRTYQDETMQAPIGHAFCCRCADRIDLSQPPTLRRSSYA